MKRKGAIQEIIDEKYGTFEVPFMRDTSYGQIVDSELDNKDEPELEVVDKPTIGQGDANHCPSDGTRKSHCVAFLIHVHG